MEVNEFKKLAENCRLKLTDEESEKIKRDLEEVIVYFNKLDSIACDNLEPAYHPIDIPESTRDDEPEEFRNKKGILDNTKTHRFYVIGPEL